MGLNLILTTQAGLLHCGYCWRLSSSTIDDCDAHRQIRHFHTSAPAAVASFGTVLAVCLCTKCLSAWYSQLKSAWPVTSQSCEVKRNIACLHGWHVAGVF